MCARHELAESWARTEAHLRAALTSLSPGPGAGERDERVQKFHEWLDHNELELALDELEALGNQVQAEDAFWRHLLLAATEMKLDRHTQRFRQKGAG